MRQLLIGLLALVSLGLLAFFTLFLSESALFSEPMRITAQFEDGDGLGEGDPVLIAGIRIGRVDSISYDPDAPTATRITVKMRLNRKVQLRDNYEILISDSSLLGGHRVLIEPGSPDQTALRVTPETALRGRVKPDMFAALDGLGEFGPALDDFRAMIADLRAGGAAENLAEGLERFASAAENIDVLTAGLVAGEGTIGKLFADDALFNTFSEVGTGVNEVIASVQSGNGVLGSLIDDVELRDRVSSAVTGVDTTFAQLSDLTSPEAGGLISTFANDPTLADDVKRSVTSIRELSEQAAAGQGTLGRLLTDSSLFDDFAAFAAKLNGGEGLIARLTEPSALFDEFSGIVTDFRSVSRRIAAGEGTLGRLLVDEEIYEQLELALRVLTRSLEDYREAAPITVFTSLITAGF